MKCTDCEKDADGNIITVLAEVVPDTKSGTPGADSVKVKGVITWVSTREALKAEVRLYDRLFTEANPDAGGRDFLEVLNPNSKRVVTAYVEPSIVSARAGDSYQFERHGYFVADRKDYTQKNFVFNRTTTLRDNWSK